jgi:hypothetical protein
LVENCKPADLVFSELVRIGFVVYEFYHEEGLWF